MKSKINLLTATVTVIVAIFISSCETISNPEPIDVINDNKTATIEGTAYANLDETNDGAGITYEPAPADTPVKVVLNSRDFVTNPVDSVDYQNLTFETTTDGSGNYNFEVPALDEPVEAEIYLGEFTFSQLQVDSTQEVKTYSPDSFPYVVSVVAGLRTINDVTYSNN